MLQKERIKAVGFDLDGTLYRRTKEIDKRVQLKIAEKILEARPQLRTIESAYEIFRKRYAILKSGTKILEEAGYSNRTMDQCLAEANIVRILKKDSRLSLIIKDISSLFFTYLITSSPGKLALQKLERLGIDYSWFNERVYSETEDGLSKREGTAFDYLLENCTIKAKNHVYIGDSKESDILPARKRGMQTIGVWSNIPEADLSIASIYNLEEVLL